MKRISQNSQVSWSRHVTVSPEKPQYYNNDVVEGARNRFRKIKANIRQGQRKAISESNLWNGATSDKAEFDTWDSQSDPGSTSRSNSKLSSLSIKTPAKQAQNEGEGSCEDDSIGSRETKHKFPVQGRSSPQNNELRKRKGANKIAGNSDFVMEIPEELVHVASDVNNIHGYTSSCVHTYLKFLYYAGVSPYKNDDLEVTEMTQRQHALSVMQKVIATYIAIMATFSSFTLTKYFILSFLEDRTLNGFIDIGYFVTAAAFQLYTTYFLAFQKNKISSMLEYWNIYDLKINDDKTGGLVNQIKWLPVANGLFTITIAALKPILMAGSWKELILANSNDVAEGIFLWQSERMENSSLIREQYGTDLNGTTYTLGIFGSLSLFCWNLQVDCFKDLIIWKAIQNKHHVLAFGTKIRDSLAMILETGKNSIEIDDQCWNAYRDVKSINSQTNTTHNWMLKISHLYSFLTFSYFLTFVLNEDIRLILVVVVGYNAMKGIIPYIFALVASNENDKCRKWIQTLPCETKRFRVGETHYTREIMLLELDKEPLGLGTGNVHINEEFIVSFVTIVASLFCFLFSLDTNNKHVTRY